jgi:mannose-6-phosphate isomerase
MEYEFAALRRLAGWFRHEALPLWAARGYDRARGGFYEAIDLAGRPRGEATRRVRVQARQIHVFANAARLGWGGAAAEIARAGFDYFLARACPDDGARGCVHLLAPDGSVNDDRRDLYDQAFLLLACASVWEALRDDRALGLAGRTIVFLDRELAAAGGGYLEDDRGTTPRRQNPHMHLFEAFLALHAATGETHWAERADRLFALFEQRFFDRKEGVLREFFSDDLARPDGALGEIIEPGHMAEWAWLLDKYRAPKDRSAEIQAALFAGAARFGRKDDSGFLPDRLRLGEVTAAVTRRLWPQTEFIKAGLVQARRGDRSAGEQAEALAGALLASYLDQPVKGLWCDQYDGSGRPIAKDAPASILYHLFEAVREIEAATTAERR